MVSVDSTPAEGLQVVVADDEQPAVDELSYLLAKDPRIGRIYPANSATEALQLLEAHPVDALFLDIHMPGLGGLELGRVISRFAKRHQPAVVFVTADEEMALEAFELAALDYLLKPVRLERLKATVQRIIEQLRPRSETEELTSSGELITVDQAGVTKMIRRSEVRYVQAQGDYARLHTPDGSYLIRVPLSELAEQWQPAGFLRVHRSYLVAMSHVQQVRLSKGSASVSIGESQLPVSRSHLPELRERMSANRLRPRG
ncbi:LytR/AlgR family response regulator transcription factor [Psychromicrobium lacuslunae]|uniref:LytR family transcriptional regulator n=1 Tax=Psychromicrobium lacuslunae TaxID=1618207 RepID=A0A0D4BVS1_9MICC|nr:LytTR family DNA-binding domain-containing protein [Psychromicrobium lacuslunae]AJT40517.1 LytR family transcriptional regulator [Psychromicrobium lacuslunae]